MGYGTQNARNKYNQGVHMCVFVCQFNVQEGFWGSTKGITGVARRKRTSCPPPHTQSDSHKSAAGRECFSRSLDKTGHTEEDWDRSNHMYP